METAEHMVNCCHADWVDALRLTIKLADKWMKLVNTNPAIRECIYHYFMERGLMEMAKVCDRMGYGGKVQENGKGTG